MRNKFSKQVGLEHSKVLMSFHLIIFGAEANKKTCYKRWNLHNWPLFNESYVCFYLSGTLYFFITEFTYLNCQKYTLFMLIREETSYNNLWSKTKIKNSKTYLIGSLRKQMYFKPFVFRCTNCFCILVKE